MFKLSSEAIVNKMKMMILCGWLVCSLGFETLAFAERPGAHGKGTLSGAPCSVRIDDAYREACESAKNDASEKAKEICTNEKRKFKFKSFIVSKKDVGPYRNACEYTCDGIVKFDCI